MDNDVKLTKNLYDNQAEKYSKKEKDFLAYGYVRKLVYARLDNVRGKKILFIGCGSGLLFSFTELFC